MRRGPKQHKKVFLPIAGAGLTQKVQAVACATPITAVDYIRAFIDTHKQQIQKRQDQLSKGEAKDAYLLILSPSKTLNFYRTKGARENLLKLIEPYSARSQEYSEEYYMALNYYSLARFPTNNFTFRKVLHHEGTSPEMVAALLKTCLEKKIPLSALNSEEMKRLS